MDELLEYFMKEPEREFHVRQLAQLAKKSPTTVSKYLSRFEKEKLLISSRKLKHLLYKANTESPAFRELKRYHNLRKLHESGLTQFLVEKFNNPAAMVLFGSYWKAEDSSKSDIDLLIITPNKNTPDLEKFEKALGRRVQLFLYSNAEIERMKTKNRELLNSFVNGIVLDGYWELYK